MSALADAAHDYVALRRAVGFKLAGVDRILADFARYLDDRGSDTVTVALALAWAGETAGTERGVARRLGLVRGFARYLQAQSPGHEVPPSRLFASGRGPRRVPHLYSAADIAALLHVARTLEPPHWAATVETVLGLLAVTGMRIGEVLALDLGDIDWEEGVLVVWLGKFNKSRLVPLAPSTLGALDTYVSARRTLGIRVPTAAVFLARGGQRRLSYNAFAKAFRAIRAEVGLSGGPRTPRIHDLRHSFAVQTLLDWYREGVDVGAHLPRLSTYLGHVSPAATYWYLSGAPELMALAAERLEPGAGGAS